MWWNEIAYSGHWVKRCSTSETCYFNWIQRASFRTSVSWLHWPFPFSKAARVLKLIGCEDKSDEVPEEPSAIFLWGVYSLIPLFASDVDGVVVQQLLAPLRKIKTVPRFVRRPSDRKDKRICQMKSNKDKIKDRFAVKCRQWKQTLMGTGNCSSWEDAFKAIGIFCNKNQWGIMNTLREKKAIYNILLHAG